MNDTQILTIALSTVPTMIAVLIGILMNNSRLTDLRHYMDARFASVDKRFDEVDRRFNEVDRRFNEGERRFSAQFEDLKDTWRAELRRVEDVLDARLKHLEEGER